MVVHREPEQDREDEERHERFDDPRLEADLVLEPALLEHQREEAVGRGGRQQVEQDCLDWDDDRAEGDEQQDEAQSEHKDEDARQVLAVEVGLVEGEGWIARDERLDPARLGKDRWHDARAHLSDDVPVGLVVERARQRVVEGRDLAVARHVGLDGTADTRNREDPVGEGLDGRLRGRLVRAGDDRDERQRGALRPLGVHEVDRLDRIDGVWERCEVSRPDMESGKWDCQGKQQDDDRGGVYQRPPHDASRQRAP